MSKTFLDSILGSTDGISKLKTRYSEVIIWLKKQKIGNDTLERACDKKNLNNDFKNFWHRNAEGMENSDVALNIIKKLCEENPDNKETVELLNKLGELFRTFSAESKEWKTLGENSSDEDVKNAVGEIENYLKSMEELKDKVSKGESEIATEYAKKFKELLCETSRFGGRILDIIDVIEGIREDTTTKKGNDLKGVLSDFYRELFRREACCSGLEKGTNGQLDYTTCRIKEKEEKDYILKLKEQDNNNELGKLKSMLNTREEITDGNIGDMVDYAYNACKFVAGVVGINSLDNLFDKADSNVKKLQKIYDEWVKCLDTLGFICFKFKHYFFSDDNTCSSIKTKKVGDLIEKYNMFIERRKKFVGELDENVNDEINKMVLGKSYPDNWKNSNNNIQRLDNNNQKNSENVLTASLLDAVNEWLPKKIKKSSYGDLGDAINRLIKCQFDLEAEARNKVENFKISESNNASEDEKKANVYFENEIKRYRKTEKVAFRKRVEKKRSVRRILRNTFIPAKTFRNFKRGATVMYYKLIGKGNAPIVTNSFKKLGKYIFTETCDGKKLFSRKEMKHKLSNITGFCSGWYNELALVLKDDILKLVELENEWDGNSAESVSNVNAEGMSSQGSKPQNSSNEKNENKISSGNKKAEKIKQSEIEKAKTVAILLIGLSCLVDNNLNFFAKEAIEGLKNSDGINNFNDSSKKGYLFKVRNILYNGFDKSNWRLNSNGEKWIKEIITPNSFNIVSVKYNRIYNYVNYSSDISKKRKEEEEKQKQTKNKDK